MILARVDAGLEVTTKTPVRLEEIVFEVISKLEVLGRQKNVKVRLILSETAQGSEDDLYLLQADSDLLRILIKNLVENAIKYSPFGKIVEVKLGGDREWISIQVTDFGPGIPKDILPKIFERFYRGPNPGNTATQGAGLGLAIAQRIAEIHEGTLIAESTIGDHTTFTAHIKRI